MKLHVVLYRRDDIMAPADPPFAFSCWADDTDDAEEQLLNVDPDADVVWRLAVENVQEAYNDYWGNT